MARTQYSGESRGFTLIELLLVVAILGMLVSLLLPSLSRARDSAKKLTCAANMKQQSMATVYYQNENKSYFPPVSPGVTNTLLPYLGYTTATISTRRQVFYCPASDGFEPLIASGTPDTWAHGASYLYNGGIQSYGFNVDVMLDGPTGKKYLVAVFGAGYDPYCSRRLEEIQFPSATFWGADAASPGFDLIFGWQTFSAYRHGAPAPAFSSSGYDVDKYYDKSGATGFNASFADGRVDFVRWDTFHRWARVPGGYPRNSPFAWF